MVIISLFKTSENIHYKTSTRHFSGPWTAHKLFSEWYQGKCETGNQGGHLRHYLFVVLELIKSCLGGKHPSDIALFIVFTTHIQFKCCQVSCVIFYSTYNTDLSFFTLLRCWLLFVFYLCWWSFVQKCWAFLWVNW